MNREGGRGLPDSGRGMTDTPFTARKFLPCTFMIRLLPRFKRGRLGMIFVTWVPLKGGEIRKERVGLVGCVKVCSASILFDANGLVAGADDSNLG